MSPSSLPDFIKHSSMIHITKRNKIEQEVSEIHLFRLKHDAKQYILRVFVNSQSLYERELGLFDYFEEMKDCYDSVCETITHFPIPLMHEDNYDFEKEKLFQDSLAPRTPEADDNLYQLILYTYYKTTNLNNDATLRKKSGDLQVETLIDIHYKKIDLISCLESSGMMLPDFTNSSISYDFRNKLITILDPCRVILVDNMCSTPSYILRAQITPKLDHELNYRHRCILENLKIEDTENFRDIFYRIMDDRLAMDMYLYLTDDRSVDPDTRRFLYSDKLSQDSQIKLKKLFCLLDKEVYFGQL